MRKTILAAMIAAMALPMMATAADVDLDTFLKRDSFTDLKLSPNGDYYAATIPLEKSDEVEIVTERVTEIRELAKEDMPAGLEVYLTGPEGFQADLNNVFAGADFTLLLSTVIVVAVLLLITYRSPVLWLVPLIVVGTADGMAGQLGRQVATFFGMVPDGSVTGILSVLVFGAGAVQALESGVGAQAHVSILLAMLLPALFFSPWACSSAATKAQVEPLPLVPVTVITRGAGRPNPRRAATCCERSRPMSMADGCNCSR